MTACDVCAFIYEISALMTRLLLQRSAIVNELKETQGLE